MRPLKPQLSKRPGAHHRLTTGRLRASMSSFHSPRVIRVGSRSSQLAMTQTRTIITALQAVHPEVKFDVVTMKTIGDKVLDKPLPNIGQTNLFTKELETALAAGEVDMIVHSLKDLPTTLPLGLEIGAVYKRDNPTDALVLHPKHSGKTLKDLPDGSVIGTSSLRRIAQLRRHYPQLVFKCVRGNLNTRLVKLDDSGEYDALILATAGLERMGWSRRISHQISVDECMYAVGQGALAVEIRSSDEATSKIVEPLNDAVTVVCCEAERAFLHCLGGGCSVPVGVASSMLDSSLVLKGAVFSLDGSKCVKDQASVSLPLDYLSLSLENMVKEGSALGKLLASRLLASGAGAILEEAKKATDSATVQFSNT